MPVAGTVPGLAWKLFDCLVSANRWASRLVVSDILGNRYFNPEYRWAGLRQYSNLRLLQARLLVLIAPGRRAPVAPVCHEHSSPLIWLDNTHHRTAELKGKALVFADLATMGTLASQHLAQVSACIHVPGARAWQRRCRARYGATRRYPADRPVHHVSREMQGVFWALKPA